MSPEVARRKAQKKSKRRRFNRCSICGEWAECRIGTSPNVWDWEYIPYKKCVNGHVVPMPRNDCLRAILRRFGQEFYDDYVESLKHVERK